MDHNENENDTTALETAQTTVAWMSVAVGAASAVVGGYFIVTSIKDEIKERRAERRALKAALGTLQDD